MKISQLKKAIQLLESSEAEKNSRIVQKNLNFFGLTVCIEIIRGGIKYSTNKKTGEPWSKTLTCDYGYFDGITSSDGDYLDVYVKECDLSNAALPIFVVDQLKPDGSDFDEYKVIIGCLDNVEAEGLFKENCHTDKCFGEITQYEIDEFKKWIEKVKQNPQI